MNSKIKPPNHIEDFMSHTVYKKEKSQKEERLSMIREQNNAMKRDASALLRYIPSFDFLSDVKIA